MKRFDTLIVDTTSDIHHITLNRPTVCNALNAEMMTELQAALAQTHNSNARVLLLQGKGQHFCAGADLQWMKNQGHDEDTLQLADLLEQLANLNQATIAIAHGRVMGGGCGLLACCDYVVAAKETRFCFSEVKIGLIAATIAPYVMRRMGYQVSKRYLMSAQTLHAAQAQQHGLIDEVCDTSRTLAQAETLAKRLRNNAPLAMRHTKALLNRLHPVPNAVRRENARQLNLQRTSSEAQEGIAAFFDKRSPAWITGDDH